MELTLAREQTCTDMYQTDQRTRNSNLQAARRHSALEGNQLGTMVKVEKILGC
uniref:Uncharacterized protein n=1 Tax=Arundo donax TaxID=35708 RepID=A0A0A9BBG5_ARUDO